MRRVTAARITTVGVICASLSSPSVARAQTVYLLAGTGVSPNGLAERQRLKAPMQVVVGKNGLVVVEQDWMDDGGRPCVSWVVITDATYAVRNEQRPGPCPIQSDARPLGGLPQGTHLATQMVFFGSGKFDAVGPDSLRIRRSQGDMSRAGQMLRNRAKRLEAARAAAAASRVGAPPAPSAALDDSAGRRGEVDRAAVPAADTVADLTGAWKDTALGGTYYVRQIGNRIWWYGQSADGTGWSNVFTGTREGAAIKGEWADVPLGATRNSGTLAIEVVSNGVLRIVEQTGGFGTTEVVR